MIFFGFAFISTREFTFYLISVSGSNGRSEITPESRGIIECIEE